jgi:glyoxylase-like metal-dependent hydrolase (beta-lactamase superfamily II)
MPGWLRIVLIVVALLIAVVLGGWYYAWGREAVPETTTYPLDIVELRRLARSLPGERPIRINHAQLTEASLPIGVVFAWKSLSVPLPFTHGAYQIVYPDGFGMIDAGLDEAAARAMAQGQEISYSNEAYAAIERGLAAARWIVITHEHVDHVGGIASYATPMDLVGRLHLTPEQLANASEVSGIPEVSPALREALQPLAYDHYHALAPGVVLIEAPGHTPGSQMVFVQLADGREVIFLGDVAWHLDQIRQLWYRPRLVTDYSLHENREQVMGEFRALHDLMQAEPDLTLLVSHDVAQRAELIRSGLLGDRFELP